ncbi:MAG: 50S ribosome-binding GTPase, partial [Candidatus Obscuribacter sp.]|nr:50S ribosome-binding GTPase [Candidatus Obscuribacter sp.]
MAPLGSQNKPLSDTAQARPGQAEHGAPKDEHGLRQIVLVGNPNVGKSVIFNALTGANADVSNYPGTTIDIARGHLGADALSDTPGVYGVSSFNDEERTARKMIIAADIVINVVSALTLERDLFLTLQLLEMGKRTLLVINQWDEAQNRGIIIDTEAIAKELGIKVLTCVAVQKKGIKAIEESIEDACLSHLETETLQQIKVLTKDQDGTEILTQAEALLLAEGDLTTAENVQNRNINLTEKLSGISRPEIYARRRQLVNDLTNKYVKRTKGTQALSTSLGRLLLHPVWGSLISFAVCYLIFYQMLGVWIAGNLVDITEKQTMKVYYEPFVRRLAANVFPDTITIKDKQFAFAQGTLAEPVKAKELDDAIKTVKGDEIDFDFWSFRTPMA